MTMKTPISKSEVNSATGMSKLNQYGWVLKDKPGELVWLPKSELLVDHSYQRAAAHKRVLNIAREWSWLACGVIIVAKREDGQRLYVVDGQHRVLAALKRSDIERLPCLLFRTDSAKEEAAGFFDANTGRRLPTSLEKWKAQLMRGDETTMFADALIRNSGRQAGNDTGPGYVRCLTAMLRAVDSDREALGQLWPLVVEICNGKPLHERIFEGLFWLDQHLEQGESLTDKRWRERVVRVGFQGLLDSAQRASTFYARGGAKVWALGMLEALNKGCRIQLTLRDGAIAA
jgi:hypothetical protein